MVGERFWNRVDRSGGLFSCWPWTGARTAKGYGQVKVEGAVRYAHRVAFERVNGPIRLGHLVRHSCDNPPCCNPAHLLEGLPADNTADMLARGRARGGVFHGEDHPAAKLTAADVREIRRLAASGIDSSEIARRFNISRSPVYAIVRRRGWRHVA